MEAGFWRRHLTHIVGWVIVTVGVLTLGVAQALPGQNTVRSDDIVNGQVKRPDIAKNAINGSRVQNGTLSGFDIKNQSLTGTDIADESLGSDDLGPNSVTSSEVANGSLTGSDVRNGTLAGIDVQDNSLTGADVRNNSLTGADINENSLSLGCGTQGALKGKVRIVGTSAMPSTFTSSSAYVKDAWSCAGQVRAYRSNKGIYIVDFPANPGRVASVTSDLTTTNDRDNIVSVKYSDQFGFFIVHVVDNGGSYEDGGFYLVSY